MIDFLGFWEICSLLTGIAYEARLEFLRPSFRGSAGPEETLRHIPDELLSLKRTVKG